MFKRFVKNEDGNFAVIMALVLVPLLGISGAAYDYTVIRKEKSALQEAADKALLAAAKDARSSTEFYALAKNYFDANYDSRGNSENLQYYAKASPTNVSLTVEKIHDTAVMGIVGVPSVEIKVHSEVAVSKFGRGIVAPNSGDIRKMLSDLDKTEKKVMRQINDLPRAEREFARKLMERKFKLIRNQVSTGEISGPVYLSK